MRLKKGKKTLPLMVLNSAYSTVTCVVLGFKTLFQNATTKCIIILTSWLVLWMLVTCWCLSLMVSCFQDANCGNTLLISLEELVKDGLLMKDELPEPVWGKLIYMSLEYYLFDFHHMVFLISLFTNQVTDVIFMQNFWSSELWCCC